MNERLLVVGDALLDRDVEGSSERLCPDAPAPVLDEARSLVRPGGAGLAAALAASEGVPVTLATALAPDEAGEELAVALLGAGVDLVDFGLEGPTPEKRRLMNDGRTLLRLDRGGPPARVGGEGGELLRRTLADAAAVLVSDYGRGVAASPALRAALAERRSELPLIWDPHPRGPVPLTGATVVTPNEEEALAFAGRAQLRRGGGTGDLALDLAERWKARSVCVTRGEKGALLALPGAGAAELPCEPAAGDPCGAGDRFAAALTVSLAGGADIDAAAEVAVGAARDFVAARGAGAMSGRRAADLVGEVRGLEELGRAPTSIEPALRVAARTRARGGTVVATGGCFDLLHVGHVRMLEAARSFGDCLIVLLNGDRSVRELKGPERPLIGELERAAMLRGLGCVDEVVTFDESEPSEALRLLRPDVWAKGGDYTAAELPEADTVASWGGRLAILPFVEGRSTTSLIEEVKRK